MACEAGRLGGGGWWFWRCATYSRCRASGPLWRCWNAPLLRDDRPIFLQQYGVICEGTSLWEWGWVIKGREDSRGHTQANSDDSHQLTAVWSLVICSIIMELNAPLTRRWARSEAQWGEWLRGAVRSLFFSGERDELERTVRGVLSPGFLIRGKSLGVVRREVIMRPRSEPPSITVTAQQSQLSPRASTDMLWLSSRHSPNCWIRNFHLAIKSWMGSSLYWLFKCEGLYAFQGSLGPILRGKWLALLWTEIISLVT